LSYRTKNGDRITYFFSTKATGVVLAFLSNEDLPTSENGWKIFPLDQEIWKQKCTIKKSIFSFGILVFHFVFLILNEVFRSPKFLFVFLFGWCFLKKKRFYMGEEKGHRGDRANGRTCCCHPYPGETIVFSFCIINFEY